MSDAEAPLSRGRLRAARVLMLLAALAAVLSAVDALVALPAAAPGTEFVEAWRAFGLVVFAGLFVLLAVAPQACRGVWELVIFHKVALTVTGIVHADVPGAATVIIADGLLSALLVSAYVLCRGWQAWRAATPTRPGAGEKEAT